MKAVLPSTDFSALLKLASSPIKNDPVKDSDACGYGRIEVRGNRIVVESTSSTMSARAVGEIEEGEDGYCCIQLETIAEMLKVMPVGEKSLIEYVDSRLKLKVGKSRCSFGCIDSDTIAPLASISEELPRIVVKFENLVGAISAASVSGEVNDADGVRSNVLLETMDDKLWAVATDNIRCSIVPAGECRQGFRGTISIKGARALKAFDCENITIVELGESIVFLDGTGSYIQFQQSAHTISSFPNFRPIMSVEHIDELKLSTERFTTVMSGANRVNPQECVMVVEDEEVVVMNVSPTDGTEYRGVAAYDGKPGYDIKVGLCPLLVTEYLKTLGSDTLSLFFSSDRNQLNSPGHIMIRDEGGSVFFVKSLVCLIETPKL